jgi:hypothetical protein
MQKAGDSIAAKLKAIKAKQEADLQSGEHHVHDVKQFNFT